MKHILETKLFENEEASYLVDLVRNDKGEKYVEITQNIHMPFTEKQVIKIQVSDVGTLINILQQFCNSPAKVKDDHNSRVQENGAVIEQIINRYLKGVPLKDLALQFDMKFGAIEMILRNNGIAIVSQEMPKYYRWQKNKKKK